MIGEVLSEAVTLAPTPTTIAPPATVVHADRVAASDPAVALPAAEQPSAPRVALVGDSLLASATVQVLSAVNGVQPHIDAEPGRTTAQGLDAIAAAAAAGPDTLVIALGTNDWGTPLEQFQRDLARVEKLVVSVPCVVWVDAQEFRVGLAEVNGQVRALVGRQPQIHLARWSAIAGPSALHTADGYHLSEEGMQAYAGLISTAVDFLCS